LNRFSNFVTSGAEDYVLNGTVNQEDAEADGAKSGHDRETTVGSTIQTNGHSTTNDGPSQGPSRAARVSEADRHFVEVTFSLLIYARENSTACFPKTPQAPPAWRSKTPPFRILVHSPSKRTSTLSGSYTIYAVTSLFLVDPNTPSHSRFPTSSSVATDIGSRSHTPTPDANGVDCPAGELVQTHVTVYRRFSQFVFLHAALTRRLPGIVIPPLPEKQYAGRFSEDFVEARRGDLERWISRIARHPVARYSEVLVFFLSCDNEAVSTSFNC
jgi:sorting nexin-9/18/33